MKTGLKKFNIFRKKHDVLTANEIYSYIDEFIPIYKNYNKVNPIPERIKVTVWCESALTNGFVCNVTAEEMRSEVNLFPVSWIYESKLQRLYRKNNQKLYKTHRT